MNLQALLSRPVLSVLIVAVPMLAFTLITPLGFDNAAYQSMAIDLLKFGKIPYIGTWDLNFPGILVIHSSSILLFGESALAFHAFDVLLQLGFVFVLYRFERNWLCHRGALIGVVLYCSWYLLGYHRMQGERDVYIGMAMICATQLLLGARSAKQDSWRVLLSGLTLGFAVLMKPTSLVLPWILLFLVPIRADSHPLSRRVSYLALSVVPLALFLIIYSFIPGGLEAFYLATIRFNLDIYTKLRGFWWVAIVGVYEGYPIYALTAVALFRILRHRTTWVDALEHPMSRKEILVFGALFMSSLALFVVQGKYLKYQLAPVTILCVPIASFGAELLLNMFPQRKQLALALLACTTLFVISVRWPAVFSIATSLGDPHGAMMASYVRPGSPTVYGDSAFFPALDYLSRPENRNASLEIASFDPHLRAVLGRPCIGRYSFLAALGMRRNPEHVDSDSYTDYQLQWRQQYVNEIQTQRPEIIVIARRLNCWYLSDVYTDLLHGLPGFDSLLSTFYRFDTSFGGEQIYKLKRY